jgi:hypothetical protein
MKFDKGEVSRLRCKAYRVDLRLTNSRVRHTHLNNHSGMMLLDPWTNTVLKGINFELNTEAAKHWIHRYGQERAR